MKMKYQAPQMHVEQIHVEGNIAVGSANDFHYYIESENGGNINNLEFFDYLENSKGENDIYL